ncbi:MAG: pilus assembly protein PilM, partial [Bacteroidota bacterium]
MAVLGVLSSLFPPPRYMLLPSAGVDISDSSLKYIQFRRDKRSGQHLKLIQWGDIDIADGALNRGDVTDGAKLTEALREVRERTGVEYVRVSLPEERAYLFETEIQKNTPYKEIRGKLEFTLEENVPLSPRDAHFDYHIFDDPLRKDALLVSVTVYAKDTINSYYDACRAAGVMP